MRAPKDRARAALLTLASGLHLAGCGGGGATSSGTFPRVDSISSLRASPTVFTLVGERFQSALGTAVTVVFDADGDGTPVAGGTSPRAEVPGTVTSDSTIAGTSPAAVLGTSTRVDAFVTVRFAGRFESRSASAIAAFEAPVVTGISRPVVDSEIPAAVQVLGGHFGTPGLAATVTFQALSGTPFGGGTTDTLVIPGTVASDEAIGLMSPVAGVSVDTPASIRVEIVDVGRGGSAGALVTFAAPTVTGFGAATVDSENPTAFTVSGTGIAGPLVVRFVAGTGTPFLGQSLATVEAAGAATLGVRVDGVTPRFGASVSTGAGVRLVFASGAVAESGPAIVTIEPPSLADAPLLAVRCEYATPLTIAGVRLGNGLPVIVRFTAGVCTPFVGGTSSTVGCDGRPGTGWWAPRSRWPTTTATSPRGCSPCTRPPELRAGWPRRASSSTAPSSAMPRGTAPSTTPRTTASGWSPGRTRRPTMRSRRGSRPSPGRCSPMARSPAHHVTWRPQTLPSRSLGRSPSASPGSPAGPLRWPRPGWPVRSRWRSSARASAPRSCCGSPGRAPLPAS